MSENTGGGGTVTQTAEVIYRKKSNGVGFIFFDAKGKVNLLTAEVMHQFEEILLKALDDDSIKALVLASGKPDTFISGADLHEILKFKTPAEALCLSAEGQALFEKLAADKKPSVVGINGICLGGGLELALCCTSRIATTAPNTLLGLPECKLGFVPGLGGTQRLPRTIGLRDSLEMLISGDPISAEQSLKLGLVDQLVPPENLLEALEAKALQLLETPKDQWRIDRETLPQAKQKTLLAATERAIRLKTRGNYPAQSKLIEVLKVGYEEGLQSGLTAEARAFSELCITETAHNLVFLFFNCDFYRQSAKAQTVKVGTTKQIGTVGIIGGGQMGTTLAHLCLTKGFKVKLKAVSSTRQEQAINSVRELVKHTNPATVSNLTPTADAAAMISELEKNLESITDFAQFSDCDLVIEAAHEELSLKKDLFKTLDQVLTETAIVASNTSSLSIAELAAGLKHEKNFVGLHFFHPVSKMPLVELVSQASSSRETIARASGFVSQLDKTPMTVKDSPCFLVNRLLGIYILEAARMAEEKTPLNWIDDAALAFGMPMGPLALLDEVGTDIGIMVANTLDQLAGDRMNPPSVMQEIIKHKIVGRKTDQERGIYSVNENGRVTGFNPILLNEMKLVVEEGKASEDVLKSLADRLILPMVDEAARCLEEKVVRRPREIDVCAVLGLGFPPFRGGLLRYADSVGIGTIIDKLEQIYAKKAAGEPNRKVSQYLHRIKEEHRGFYSRGAEDES